MAMLPPTYASGSVEQEARAFWRARALPPAAGFLGAADGPSVRQLLGTYTPGDSVTAVAQRALAADVDARYLALTGRKVLGTLRREGWTEAARADPVASALERLAVWVGGEGGRTWDDVNRTEGLERIVGRLARRGVVVARELPLRLCPSCSAPRSPERIIYQEEEGDTQLVRFRVPLDDGLVANAVVWVDAPWRLLATSAVLVNPDLPYVVARYRRRETSDVVLTSRSSLERFAAWMPGAEFEVLSERPGREFAGRPYVYPLAHEFPMGGDLPPPSGTIVAVADVTDTGTGIVPLVPGHGALDAAIAEANGVSGWPVVTSSGTLDSSLKHKYAGLDLKTATEFVVRDLEEGGLVFARLRVRRGVPHCALCGTALLWSPARAWCLEPGRLSTELDETYHRLLPHAPALPHVEVAPWPVSESRESDEPSAVAALECPQCERLDELDGSPTCSCGSTRFPVRRRLVPSAAGSFGAWAALDPIPPADLVRLYLNERRAVPTVIHHVTALSAVEGTPTDLGASVLPTVPEADLVELASTHGADAVRAALAGSSSVGRMHGPFVERCLQEHRRLERLWARVAELLERLDPVTLAALSPPITGFLSELEPEDRALLARWERTRVRALADYDRWTAAAAYRGVFRFLETDLADYSDWVRPRIELAGAPPSKRAALRTLVHTLVSALTLLGPVVPHTADRLYRALVPDRASLFEGRLAGVETALLSDDLSSAWDRWRSVVESTRALRAGGVDPPGPTVPAVALVVADDALGEKLRKEAPVIQRLAGIGRLEVGSPTRPWLGRERRLRPNEGEIQRIFGSQASQITHLLRRIPPRRNVGRTDPSELSVVIQGVRHYVQPSMVTYSDSLPEGMVPTPWRLGEMYVRREDPVRPEAAGLPPLSPDAYWLVRRLARRLRRGGPTGSPGRVAIVATPDPLATELRSVAGPVAAHLGLAELRVDEQVEETPPRGRISGRTRTGSRWWVDVPGVAERVRPPKHRSSVRRRRRLPVGSTPLHPPVEEVDHASPDVIAREQAIRVLNEELDAVLGVPVLGPTKVAVAWDQGLRGLEQYRQASYETLVALPGFGRSVAELVFVRLGRPAPRRPAHRPAARRRAVSRAATEANAEIDSAPALDTPPYRSPAPIAHDGENSSVEPGSVAVPTMAAGAGGPEFDTPNTDHAVPHELPAASSGASTQTPTEPAAAAPEHDGLAGHGNGLPPHETSLEERSATPVLEDTAPSDHGEEIPPPSPAVAELDVPTGLAPSGAEEGLAETRSPRADPSDGSPVTVDRQHETAPPVIAAVAAAAVGASEFPDWGSVAPDPDPDPRSEEASSPGPSPEVAPREELTLPSETFEAAADDSGEAFRRTPDLASALPEDDASRRVDSESPESTASDLEDPPEEFVTAPLTVAPLEPTSLEDTGTPEPPSGRPVGPDPFDGNVLPAQASSSLATPEREVSGAPVEGEGPAWPAPIAPDEAPGVSGPAEAAGPAVSVDLPEEVPADSTSPPLMPEESESSPIAPLSAEEPTPVPEPQASPSPRAGVEMEVGGTILTSLQPFLDATAAGLPGLCLVRESPERMAARVGRRPVEIVWMTNFGRGRTVRPTDLPGIFGELEREVVEGGRAAFFVEGLEYLVRIHGAEAVADRLAAFERLALDHDVRAWIHVSPDLLRPSEVELLLGRFRSVAPDA